MKRKITAWGLVLTFILCIIPIISLPVAADIITSNFIAPIDPIPTSADIVWVNQSNIGKINWFQSGKYYALEENIDLFRVAWVPIGTAATPFTGTFDGRGYVIRNLTIGTKRLPKNIQDAGLFGYVANATIKNVGLEETFINTSSTNPNAGGICGTVANTGSISISNCYNIGDVSSSLSNTSNSNAGGICGYVPSSSSISISNCYNKGEVSSIASTNSNAGGICGYVPGSGSISNCYNIGDVFSSSVINSRAGGICGYSSGSVSKCYNTGDVSSTSDNDSYTGGICGATSGSGSISNCYNTGGVSSTSDNDSYTGGICGYSSGSNSISNCYWNADSAQIVNGNANIYKKGVGSDLDTTTPLTSAQMRVATNFTGWDFNTIWDYKESVNNGYPILRVFFPDGMTVSGKVQSYVPELVTKIILLQGNSIKYTTTIAAIDKEGQRTQDFTIEGVAPGTYTLEITKTLHEKYSINIIVGNNNLILQEVITLMFGDLDGDDKVTAADATFILRTIVGLDP